MKTKILSIFLALLMAFSLISIGSADTGANRDADPCDHDHATLCEACDELHEDAPAPAEAIEEAEEPETLEPVEEPEAIEEPETVEPVEIPEAIEEPETVEPVEIPEEPEGIEAVELMDETDNDPETCLHENTVEESYEKDVIYTDTGDNWGHMESGIRVYYTYCEDCETVVSEQEVPFTETASHVYDENSSCELCGHINTCTHENRSDMYEGWDYETCTYTDIGDTFEHEVSGLHQWYTICEDCGKEIVERSEIMTGRERHSYGDDGICGSCGHVNTCSHESFYEYWHWDPDHPNTFTDTGDNLIHQASGVRVWVKTCKDCGQNFEYRNEEYTGEDYHSYYGGDSEECYYCGHVNTCTHEHTYEERYWKDETKNTYIDTGDNAKHKVSGFVKVYTLCSDCGQSLAEGYREEEYSVMKDHNYDANGKCKNCGHVMTYTITAVASPTAGGTVTGAGKYETGTSVKLTAKANNGYVFVNWTENGKEVSKSATYSFKASADRKLTANFEKAPIPAFEGTVELDKTAVEFKGSTPYRVYNGKAQIPGVIVKDKSGKTVATSAYTVTYRDNVKPGTAYADVVMKDTGAKKSVWFKIYLPATTSTTVKNVAKYFDGNAFIDAIRVSWKKVEGAKGYVIYRRAWNLKSSGWTKFERWNNTTKTSWVDTKVYPGTRYQYGVKAYFKDAMDNYNLGLVGPLKTTVFITSRDLNHSASSLYSFRMKWAPSSLFTGYQIQIANDDDFKKIVETVTIKDPTKTTYTYKGIKKNTWYYARIRQYHVFEGVTYYGDWSLPIGTLRWK